MVRTTMTVAKARDLFLGKRLHVQSARRDTASGDIVDVRHDRFIVSHVRSDGGKLVISGMDDGNPHWVSVTQCTAVKLAAHGDVFVDNPERPYRVTVLQENDFW